MIGQAWELEGRPCPTAQIVRASAPQMPPNESDEPESAIVHDAPFQW